MFYRSLVEMAGLVRSRKLSPVELVGMHLARIDQLNPKMNAFVHIDSEGAMDAARVAEVSLASRAAPDTFGPLFGVPLSVKSSMEVAGWRCECGSALRRNYVATEDAPLVAPFGGGGPGFFGEHHGAGF